MSQLILFVGLLIITMGLLIITIAYLTRDSLCEYGNPVISAFVVLGAVIIAERFIFITLVNIYKLHLL